MLGRKWIAAIPLTAALAMTFGSAQAFDESKYPDLKGVWNRSGSNSPGTARRQGAAHAGIPGGL